MNNMNNVNRELGKELYKALQSMKERNRAFETWCQERKEKYPELAGCEVEVEDGGFNNDFKPASASSVSYPATYDERVEAITKFDEWIRKLDRDNGNNIMISSCQEKGIIVGECSLKSYLEGVGYTDMNRAVGMFMVWWLTEGKMWFEDWKKGNEENVD